MLFFNLEEDPTLFQGQGDPQFEVYRTMRKAVKQDWETFCPKTNVVWIRYLVDKLLAKCKSHRKRFSVL